MLNAPHPPELESMRLAAMEAGAFLKETQKQARTNLDVLRLRNKSKSVTVSEDLVGYCDEQSEAIIKAILTTRHPDIPVVGEETGGKRLSKGRYFLVDPLDGTNMFAGLSLEWGINIALVEDNVVTAGLIYCPRSHMMVCASEAGGLTHVSGPTPALPQSPEGLTRIIIENCIVPKDSLCGLVTQFSYATLRNNVSMKKDGATSWRFAEMAFHADNRAYVGDGLKDLDFAPGLIILRKAGFVLTDFNGAPATLASTEIIAAPNRLHPQILKIISAAKACQSSINTALEPAISQLRFNLS